MLVYDKVLKFLTYPIFLLLCLLFFICNDLVLEKDNREVCKI